MLTRKRLLVGSVSSIVWPLVTVLIPAGITFAAARVYAEAAPAPESCEAGVVTDCASVAPGSVCHACTTGTCACFDGTCWDAGGGSIVSVKVCRDVPKCESFPDGDKACQGKAEGAGCSTESPTPEPGECKPSPHTCLPDDGGPVITTSRGLFCYPKATTSSSSSSSSSSSGDNGGSTGFVPGPATVPGSSSSSTSGGSSDDSGCATSSTTTIPLFAAPLALGLLFALRRKRQPRNAPRARKRS
ncbi:MAG: hypothetical protein U0270_27885 [Labilithrix sp.]